MDDGRGDDLGRAAAIVAAAERLVVFTGAGVSRESGIPTFREPETGLWARYDPMELATLEGFLRNPTLVWQWYEHRFGIAADAEPNPGHLAIAALEELVPQVVVVTQNIDGLHQRAGSSDVVELHGTMHTFRCLPGRHRGFGWDVVRAQERRPPRCPECGELLRPEVVWFGEALPQAALERAQRLALACDAMLVVGTSGVVYPAAAIPAAAKHAGAHLVDVNPTPDALSRLSDVFLEGPGGEVLPTLVEAVRELRR